MKKYIMITLMALSFEANAILIDDFSNRNYASDEGVYNSDTTNTIYSQSGSDLKNLKIALTASSVNGMLNSSTSFTESGKLSISNTTYNSPPVGYSTFIWYTFAKTDFSKEKGFLFDVTPLVSKYETNSFISFNVDGYTSAFHKFKDNDVFVDFSEFHDNVDFSKLTNIRVDFFGVRYFSGNAILSTVPVVETSAVPTPSSLSCFILAMLMLSFLNKNNLKRI